MAKKKDKKNEKDNQKNTVKEEQGEKQESGKKGKKNKKDKKNKKKKGCLIPLIFFAVLIGLAVWILGFNGLNIREKYLRPTLENVPIIKNILPPAPEEAQTDEPPQQTEEQKTIDELTKKVDSLQKEVARLEVFEKEQAQFKKDKEAFDKTLALNDPKQYIEYYEKISPENAENLYKQAVEQTEKDKKFKEYIQTFESMKKDAIATVLEELILTDTDLVITILENLSSEKRAEVLATMKPENAAVCTRLLSPQ